MVKTYLWKFQFKSTSRSSESKLHYFLSNKPVCNLQNMSQNQFFWSNFIKHNKNNNRNLSKFSDFYQLNQLQVKKKLFWFWSVKYTEHRRSGQNLRLLCFFYRYVFLIWDFNAWPLVNMKFLEVFSKFVSLLNSDFSMRKSRTLLTKLRKCWTKNLTL